MIEPVVIPVSVDVTQGGQQVDAFAEKVRAARAELSGTTTAAGAAAERIQTPGTDETAPPSTPLSVASIQRSLEAVERTGARLAQTFERLDQLLVRVLSQSSGTTTGSTASTVPPGTPVPDPAVQPPPPPGGGGRRGGGDEDGGGGGWGTTPLWGMGRNLVRGTMGLVGLTGAATGFSEMRRWIEGARSFGLEAAMAELASGRPGTYEAVEAGARDERGFRSIVAPDSAARATGQMLRIGMGAEDPARAARDALLLGEMGLRGLGSEQGGMAMGIQAYEGLRTERVVEYLASLVQIGQTQGLHLGNLLTQFSGLRQAMEGREGQYQRSDAELLELMGLQVWLSKLPADVGQGAGGVQIAQGVQAFGRQPGVGRAVAMLAYMEETGKPMPQSTEDVIAMERWLQRPESIRPIARKAKQELGPELAAWEMSGRGAGPMEPYFRMMEGVDEPVPEEAQRLVPRREAEAAVTRAAPRFEETPGGRELLTQIEQALTRAERSQLLTWEQRIRRFSAQHPEATAAVGTAATIGTTYYGAQAARQLLAGAGAAEGVAGTAAKLGVGATARGLAGPVFGGAAIAKDLYDVTTGEDPTNLRDMLIGLVGALAAAGFVGATGGAGALPLLGAGATGYGTTKGGLALYDLLRPEAAEAALPPVNVENVTEPSRIPPEFMTDPPSAAAPPDFGPLSAGASSPPVESRVANTPTPGGLPEPEQLLETETRTPVQAPIELERTLPPESEPGAGFETATRTRIDAPHRPMPREPLFHPMRATGLPRIAPADAGTARPDAPGDRSQAPRAEPHASAAALPPGRAEGSESVRSLIRYHQDNRGRRLVDLRSPIFASAEQAYGLPPGLLAGTAAVESSGNPFAVSRTGVRGLMQITQRTGAPYGLTDRNRWDPAVQVDVAARHYADLLQRHGGNLTQAIRSYGDPNEASYANKVLRAMERFGQRAPESVPQYTPPDELASAIPPMQAAAPAPDPGVAFEPRPGRAAGLEGEVHLFVHLDPSFPGHVDVDAPPNVTVRQVD